MACPLLPVYKHLATWVLIVPDVWTQSKQYFHIPVPSFAVMWSRCVRLLATLPLRRAARVVKWYHRISLCPDSPYGTILTEVVTHRRLLRSHHSRVEAGYPAGFDAGDCTVDIAFTGLGEALVNDLTAVGIRRRQA
jgi:hypothetical protein